MRCGLSLADLSGCEMGLKLAGVKLAGSSVLAAMENFSSTRPCCPSAARRLEPKFSSLSN